MKPGKCLDRIERIKNVERECSVAKIAAGALAEALRQDPRTLTGACLKQSDLDAFQSRLEDTYLIRLFAEFETGIRDYWTHNLNRGPTYARDVIDALAARHRIAETTRTQAHVVRKYRNRLVHEEDAEADAVPLEDARRSLCRFLGFLPPDW